MIWLFPQWDSDNDSASIYLCHVRYRTTTRSFLLYQTTDNWIMLFVIAHRMIHNTHRPILLNGSLSGNNYWHTSMIITIFVFSGASGNAVFCILYYGTSWGRYIWSGEGTVVLCYYYIQLVWVYHCCGLQGFRATLFKGCHCILFSK